MLSIKSYTFLNSKYEPSTAFWVLLKHANHLNNSNGTLVQITYYFSFIDNKTEPQKH